MTFKVESLNNKLKVDKPENFNELKDKKIQFEVPVIKCNEALELICELPCGYKGVIPFEEVEFNSTDKPIKPISALTKVGKFVVVQIDSINHESKTIKLSRKKAQERCYNEYVSKLELGDIIPAKITHVDNFACFCDIGFGITAFLPVCNLCIVRVSNLQDVVSEGQMLNVVVSGRDDFGRLILSHRELLGTWEENIKDFQVGDIVDGVVRYKEDYGYFIQLTPNLSGLTEADVNVRVGEHCQVRIKSIIPEKMKIKLSVVCSGNSEIHPQTKMDFKYFIDEKVNHIDSWQYSPENSSKSIKTTFKES